MNVLKEARQRAGRRAAAIRVLVPLVLMLALVFSAIMIAAALGYPIGSKLWPFALLAAIMTAIPLGMVIMFFVARKDPQLVRRELDTMIRGEEITISMCEAAIVKFSREVQDMKSGLHLHESRVEMSRRMKKETLARIEKSLARLRETYEKADDRYKIKRQEHFLALQAQIRDQEDFLQYMRDPATETSLLPEKEYSDMLQIARRTAAGMEERFETATAPLRQLIHESRRIVAEAKQAREQIPG
ncbi:MAG: hypothetical protein WC790_02785 [Candidatus Paceibacterota bacterium]